VIDSTDINAFAAPGGYIFVTRGLYRVLHNESELAGVLAHEISQSSTNTTLKILQQSQSAALGEKIFSEKYGESELVEKLIGEGAEMFARSFYT
jgi:predicted Zn-dependent protease